MKSSAILDVDQYKSYWWCTVYFSSHPQATGYWTKIFTKNRKTDRQTNIQTNRQKQRDRQSWDDRLILINFYWQIIELLAQASGNEKVPSNWLLLSYLTDNCSPPSFVCSLGNSKLFNPSQDTSIGSISTWYWEIPGSNPGKCKNVAMKISNWIIWFLMATAYSLSILTVGALVHGGCTRWNRVDFDIMQCVKLMIEI